MLAASSHLCLSPLSPTSALSHLCDTQFAYHRAEKPTGAPLQMYLMLMPYLPYLLYLPYLPYLPYLLYLPYLPYLELWHQQLLHWLSLVLVSAQEACRLLQLTVRHTYVATELTELMEGGGQLESLSKRTLLELLHAQSFCCSKTTQVVKQDACIAG